MPYYRTVIEIEVLSDTTGGLSSFVYLTYIVH